jgi:methionine synthase II (cobalamin-independent)
VFRAEVVGSMLRPAYLKEARAALESGQLTLPQFKRIEDRAVDQVIAAQEGSGVEVVTDGEMRRFLFMGPITETVSGIEMVEEGTTMPWASPDGELEWTSPAAVTSTLQKKRSLVSEEYSYARARARLPLKVTVPSPLVLYGFWNTTHSTAAYNDPFEMFPTRPRSGARRSRSWWRSAASTSRSTRRSWRPWSIRGSAIGPRPRACRRTGC